MISKSVYFRKHFLGFWKYTEKNNGGTVMGKSNRIAIAALVLGIISIITWLLPIAGYITTILAIVLGVKGRKSEKSTAATAGMVLGIIFLIITFINSVVGVILALFAVRS